MIGAGIFLGFAATFYTLLLAYSAFTVVLMALLLAASRWRDGIKAALDPLVRLAVIAVIAAALAATTWLPFLLRAAVIRSATPAARFTICRQTAPS